MIELLKKHETTLQPLIMSFVSVLTNIGDEMGINHKKKSTVIHSPLFFNHLATTSTTQ